MYNHPRSRSSQLLLAAGLVTIVAQITAGGMTNEKPAAEILVRRLTNSTAGGETVPKIFKLTPNGEEEIKRSAFTLKSDPVKVLSGFKTVDISVLNRERDKENAKKVAIIHEDLQSRIKIGDANTANPEGRESKENTTEVEIVDPEEMVKKQAKVREDLESRLFAGDALFGLLQSPYEEEKHHYAVKRSGSDYYVEEPIPGGGAHETATTTPAKEEEESFFSILESLFGSSDDDSQSKKKASPEDDLLFKEPEDSIKDNIKTVGDILKPIKPIDESEPKNKNVHKRYETEIPEYRIVNNFHASQSHKHGYNKPFEAKPNYQNFYRPITEKPFPPYRPHSTNGYEDYDLDEFVDKGETTTRVKYVSPVLTTSVYNDPVTTPKAVTITSNKPMTTRNNVYDNGKLKFPSIQKKNDYINRNRYQSTKNDSAERETGKPTERTTPHKQETTSTTEKQLTTKPNDFYETKINEVKPQKIHESPNFYNLINLPVRYSTKDTAIPLISTSYANTKIQGMGAHKYENGKYPNHKYEQVNTSTTKKPNYWATKRTEAPKVTYRASTTAYSSTSKFPSNNDFERMNYDEVQIGLGPVFGGYGSKKGVEVKTQTSVQTQSTPLSSTSFEELASKTNMNLNTGEMTHKSTTSTPNSTEEELGETPEKLEPEDYDYDTVPAKVEALRPLNQNPSPQVPEIKNQNLNELQNSKEYQGIRFKEPIMPATDQEIAEYEYYDYDTDVSTVMPSKVTTITTTTASTTMTTTTTAPKSSFKYSFKYPSLNKDKIYAASNEKVAVVVPSKDHSFYNEVKTERVQSPSTLPVRSPTITTTTSPTTTTTRTWHTQSFTPKSSQTSTILQPTNSEGTTPKKVTSQYTNQKFVPKEPAPVFEKVEEPEDYTTKSLPVFTTRRPITEKTTTEEPTKRPVILSSPSKLQDQESNINIVLVPTKETVTTAEADKKQSHPELSPGPIYTTQTKPAVSHPMSHDYTTEFTVGLVQGHGGKPSFHFNKNNPSHQGHFVASSISTNPYGDDEPFRPIPKPSGMSASFQVVDDQVPRQPNANPNSNPTQFQNKRPLQTSKDKNDPHKPHVFIPSPQFHRPPGPARPPSDIKTANSDYDFDGIQTEPKPGQYVIFSKPQLNPELNENQNKKKLEVPNKAVSNVPYLHDSVNQFSNKESQKHVIFNPKEGQFYQSGAIPVSGLQPSEKVEQGRPNYANLVEKNDDELPLELVPPRGIQTEKPFEGNFVVPDSEKKESTSYPRPHWEKNGKPLFLLNGMSNKNDHNRHPPIPSHMVPTLVPPSSNSPQRFRRPGPPHMSSPIRKNFNEATTNVKPKPNLPNILPQFRPNTKVGSGPYHRPTNYMGPNRRNGINRYQEKEHGNFPYHIHHPDKDVMLHREYDLGPEITPKFITNRGKLPSDSWSGHEMQKRFGQGLTNVESKLEFLERSPPNPKILKRLQRTPVITLQMLKQMPGVKTQKLQISREEKVDPLMPPIYRNYPDQPKTEENLYIVYPAKAPQKLHPDNGKVFIVSDLKSQKKLYNFTKPGEQHPLLHPNKRISNYDEKSKNDFPYGFVRPEEKLESVKKQTKGNEVLRKNVKANDGVDVPQKEHKVVPEPIPDSYTDKIDMNLHMQSNNQWNEVKTSQDKKIQVANTKPGGDRFRFSDLSQENDKNGIQVNPPSEYRTSIADGKDSAFTLGAVMHTTSHGSRKGQVSSVPLNNSDKELDLPQLNVNERISNGRIVTVSMPLDVKEDHEMEEKSNSQHFQAPFQASFSINTNDSQSTNQGWTVVKNPDDISDVEEGRETTEISTTRFNFENFKPELIGGFKPIYELPETTEETKSEEKLVEREEKALNSKNYR